MEQRNGQENWFRRKFRSLRSYVRGKGQRHGPSTLQSQTETPRALPENTPLSYPSTGPSTGIDECTTTPSPAAARSPNGEPAESSTEPSHNTTYLTQNDNHDLTSTSGSGLPTRIGNGIGTEEAISGEYEHEFKELLGPKQLWMAAYEKLRDDEPEVLKRYEQLLLKKRRSGQTEDNQPQPQNGDWQDHVQKLARERLEEIQRGRMSFEMGEKNVVIRDQLQKALGFIVSTKDIVAAAISSQPYAALAWAGVMFVLPLLKTMLQQDNEAIEGFEYIVSLLVRCKLMEDDFLQPRTGDTNPSESDHKLALSLQAKTIELYSNVYKYQIRVVLHFGRSTLGRYSRDLVVSNDWKGMIQKLKATETEIDRDQQSLSNHLIDKIDEKLEDFRSKAQDFLELCKRNVESIRDIEQASHLGHLPVAHSAAFNALEIERERCCTPGTRLEILGILQKWLEDPTGESILWLHGMAGTGKSTIARTVATALNRNTSLTGDARLSEHISLAATFFFKRDDAKRNRADVLFTTFAHQLAHKPFGLGGEIAAAIKENASPSIGVRSLKTQWDELILKPLKTLREESPSLIRLVFIIDALDECRASDTQTTRKDAQEIIESLLQAEQLSNVQVRVLITSRNEIHIDNAFKSQRQIFYVGVELPKVSVGDRHDRKKDDITIFFESELPERRLDNGESSKWLSANDIRKLVEKAGGLFIYAATLCKFLDVEPLETAKRRLDELLKGNPNEKSPESFLNQIYSTVLDYSTQELTDEEKQDSPLNEILGLLVVLFKPLQIRSLAEFTNPRKSERTTGDYLKTLRSVVDIPKDPKSPVSLVHLSFREFLLDDRRCKPTVFLVKPSTVHYPLFRRCLEIMSDGLHMDICGLRKPGILSVEIPSDLVQQYITPHLQYACRYWVDHLLQITGTQQVGNTPVDESSIYKFLQKKILNWLEVLSLIGEVGSAVHMVDHLRSLTRDNPEISEFLRDAHRFLLANRHIIQEAPLQVYYSAILFSPATSIIRSLFLEPLGEWIMKFPTVDDTWGAELMTLEGHESAVYAVAISPDSKTIISGSRDGTIRFWEVATGIETTKVQTRGPVRSLALSSDGKTVGLIFKRSSEIGLYDVETGEKSYLLGHANVVLDIAFSPCSDSTILASVAEDKTFRLWDASTRQQISMHKFLSKPSSVAFAPNGNMVAVGFAKNVDTNSSTVRILNIKTGDTIAEFGSKPYFISSLAFSPDGVSIASATFEGQLQIWNIESGATLADLRLDTMIEVITFSPGGEALAIGLADGTIQFWDPVSREQVRELRNHTQQVRDIVFSPDGKIMASALDDCTLRLFDVKASDKAEVIKERDLWEITIPRDSDVALVVEREMTTVWDLNEFKPKPSIPFWLDQCTPDGKIATSDPHDKNIQAYDAIRGVIEGDNNIQVWDVATGEQLANFEGARGSLFPDNETLVVAWPYAILILETTAWEERARFETKDDIVRASIQVAVENNVILWVTKTAYSQYLHLGNLEPGVVLHRVETGSGDPRLSPDGTLAAFKAGKDVHLLDVNTKEVRARLPYHGSGDMVDILFSPDSTSVATTTHESGTHISKITLWDTTTGHPLHTLQMENIHEVCAIAPDGQVACLDWDRSLFVWDFFTEKVQCRLHSDGFRLVFSEDSKYLEGPHGRLPLPSPTRDFGCLYMDKDWVLQGGERLLWIPQAYRPLRNKVGVQGGTIVLGLASGSVVFIKIDLENTPLAKQERGRSQDEKETIRSATVE
ncbi:WD40 repeat-like protein [Hypoxylon sp. FL0543]|nr:WD40 repeat-like protein [Hypoxylon sp. FL0543]